MGVLQKRKVAFAMVLIVWKGTHLRNSRLQLCGRSFFGDNMKNMISNSAHLRNSFLLVTSVLIFLQPLKAAAETASTEPHVLPEKCSLRFFFEKQERSTDL